MTDAVDDTARAPDGEATTGPAIRRLGRDAAVEDVVAILRADGACIVENRLSTDQVAALRASLEPLMATAQTGRDEFHGVETKRIGALLAHSAEVRDLAVDRLVIDVTEAFLGPWTHKVQLMLTQLIAIGPSETVQAFHRDRLAWGGFIPREIEPQLNTMWALTDFTAENGATRVVPGSAVWDSERAATDDEWCQAEMLAGSVMLFTGSVIHSGGANRTDEVRMGLNMDYCLDWLRQEENQYLTCPPEIAKDFSQELADLVGYTGGGFALGYWSDPNDTVDRSTKQAETAIRDTGDGSSILSDAAYADDGTRR